MRSLPPGQTQPRQADGLCQGSTAIVKNNDDKESGFPRKPSDELQEIIERFKNRKKGLKRIDRQMNETGQTHVSLTEPTSRSLLLGRGHHTKVAYPGLPQGRKRTDDRRQQILVEITEKARHAVCTGWPAVESQVQFTPPLINYSSNLVPRLIL
jgi:hypothetical protein